MAETVAAVIVAVAWWRELIFVTSELVLLVGAVFFVAFAVGWFAGPLFATVRAGWRLFESLEPSDDHRVELRMTVDEAFVRQLHAEALRDDPETPELDGFRRLLVAGLLAGELGFLEGATRRHLAGATLEVVSGG